jgi:hypothetical protein
MFVGIILVSVLVHGGHSMRIEALHGGVPYPPEIPQATSAVHRLFLWLVSMTKMIDAHSSCSEEMGVIASGLKPAEPVSIPGHDEKTCSAVGHLSLFWLQIKRPFFIHCPATHRVAL